MAVITAVGLVACSAGNANESASHVADMSSQAASDEAAASTTAAKKPALEFSVKDGATDVDPSKPVTVTSNRKGLQTVTMYNEVGYVVAEKLSEDGKVWSTNEPLGYNRTYTIEATDTSGNSKTITWKTKVVNGSTSVSVSPLDGSEVGVGQTIGLRFEVPIQDRKAVQDMIEIKTEPQVEGAFYWLNPYEVRWRPQKYWEPGTKVSVKANIKGKNLGGDIYGVDDNGTSFTIGDRVISIVDDKTKTMNVYKNGKLLRSIPVSLGADGMWPTPNGQYIVGDMHTQLMMDSTTYGLALDAGGYQTLVDYATQLSYSGIYVHAAPWSVWAQGSQNTSHGCINVTTEAAQWFQSISKRGDIVQVKNTAGDTLPVGDGLGDWNLSWDKWSKGNADEI